MLPDATPAAGAIDTLSIVSTYCANSAAGIAITAHAFPRSDLGHPRRLHWHAGRGVHRKVAAVVAVRPWATGHGLQLKAVAVVGGGAGCGAGRTGGACLECMAVLESAPCYDWDSDRGHHMPHMVGRSFRGKCRVIYLAVTDLLPKQGILKLVRCM